MKKCLSLVLAFSISSIAIAEGDEVANHLAPSADFIELSNIYQNRPKVSPENNAFVYLMGLTAPKNKAPIAFGQSIIDWSNQTIANSGKNNQPRPKRIFSWDDDSSTYKLMQKITCNIRKPAPCSLDKYQELARQAINNKADLLQRRQELLALPNYQNIMPVDIMASFPPYGADIQLQQLALIALWLNRNHYSPEKIKQALQKDYDFRIKQATHAVTLVEKVVAVTGLQNHYYWLNELLKSVDNDKATEITPDYLQQPIPQAVLSMQMTFAGELQFFTSVFKKYNTDENLNPTAHLLSDTEKQRLLNYKATLLNALIHSSESEDYKAQLEQLKEDKTIRHYLKALKEFSKENGGWDIVDNYEGGDDFRELVTPVIKYIDRTQRVVAIQKAVNVLYQMRQQNIKPAEIVDFLNQPKHHHPLTGKAFTWDSEKQQIVIPTDDFTYYLTLYSHAN